MSKITKAIITTSTDEIREVKFLSARIIREGGRTVDSATITFPASTDIQQNDKISFIQDSADLTYLTAIYNFQGYVLDESGNNLDPTTQPTGTTIFPNNSLSINSFNYSNDSLKRNHANYCMVYDDTFTTISNNAKFDFSGQFDVIATCSIKVTATTVDTKRIFFSKIDYSGNGLELGVIYKSTGWKGYARVRYNSIERIYLDDNIIGYSSTPFMIRIWRDESNRIKVSFNNYISGSWYNGVTSLDITDLNVEDYSLANTTNILIGAGRDGSGVESSNWKGIAHQLRIYNGSFLSEEDFEKLYLSPSIPVTMKFGGKVYSINDSTNKKTAICKGNSDIILSSNLTHTQFDNSTPNDSSFVTRVSVNSVKKNIYPATTNINNLIKSLLLLTDDTFKLIVNTGISASYPISGLFIAEGSFLTILKTLGVIDDSVFWSNGRKVMFIEKDDGISTNISYNSGMGIGNRGCSIRDMGISDEYLVNAIEVIGRVIQKHKKINNISSVSNGVTQTLVDYPINLIITAQNSGFLNTTLIESVDYNVDYDHRIITFLSSFTNINIEYDYEDLSNSNSYHFRLGITDNSIAKYGIKAKRIVIPQLTVQNDLSIFAQKLLSSSGLVKQRYEILVPYIDNLVRENHIVKIQNLKTKSETPNSPILSLKVKQIEYRYPEGYTKIQVGENLIDGFEYEQLTKNTINSTLSALMKTKN